METEKDSLQKTAVQNKAPITLKRDGAKFRILITNRDDEESTPDGVLPCFWACFLGIKIRNKGVLNNNFVFLPRENIKYGVVPRKRIK